jgi:hypothetical protein
MTRGYDPNCRKVPCDSPHLTITFKDAEMRFACRVGDMIVRVACSAQHEVFKLQLLCPGVLGLGRGGSRFLRASSYLESKMM